MGEQLMVNPFKDIPLRQIYGIVFIIFFLTILASYLYLFKNPVRQYTSLYQSRVFLESKVSTGTNINDEITSLQEKVDTLKLSLYGENSAIPAPKLVAYNIERLDVLSDRHAVRLESVKPDNSQLVQMFEEIPITIRVSGSYFNLYAWLHNVEKELGPMVVKQFDLLPKMGTTELTMNLRMVSYLPLEK